MEILEAVERLPSLAVAQEEAVGKVLVVVMVDKVVDVFLVQAVGVQEEETLELVMVDKVASGNMVLPLVV